MCTISIKEIMMDNDYPTSGNMLYDILKSNFSKGEKVILDMSDVQVIPSMFLNVSLGRLIKEHNADYVRNNVTFKNIRISDAERIREYVMRF